MTGQRWRIFSILAWGGGLTWGGGGVEGLMPGIQRELFQDVGLYWGGLYQVSKGKCLMGWGLYWMGEMLKGSKEEVEE